MQLVYKVAVIARFLNLTERRIQQLARDGIIPKPEKGKYDLVGCVQGYTGYLQARAFGKEVIHADAHQERARLLKAQADKTELEVKTLRSELIPSDEIAAEWAGLVVAFRSRLLVLPTRGAHLATGLKEFHEIESGLRELVHEALNELSLYDPQTISNPDFQNSEISSATSLDDGESVGGPAPPTEFRGQRGAG